MKRCLPRSTRKGEHCTEWLRLVLMAITIISRTPGAWAQTPTTTFNPDSMPDLPGVTVIAKPYREVIPAQTLSGVQLRALNSFSVADAIRFFSGIQIKDYGGIGGLKTVNVRSMGTHHVGVFYDGIQLFNAQNGTVDLGKFSLDNIEEISLYNGQKSDIFQPAKDFASSASVYLRSRSPMFKIGKPYNIKAVIKGGSFDLINPSVLYERKITKHINGMANVEYIKSSGRYKYRYRRVMPISHEVKWDTTAIRENGDIQSVRIEGGVYGDLPYGAWKVKAYFYDSERGIPGAIVNNIWKNSQRQWDRSFFVQGSYKQSLTDRYSLMVNAKYAYDYMRYLNPDTTLMLIDNTFKQDETYLSCSNKYKITPRWEASFASDFQMNRLNADLAGFVYPRRYSWLNVLATAVNNGDFKAQASLLATYVNEQVATGNTLIQDAVKAAPDKFELTPAVYLSYAPHQVKGLSTRAFYKKIFRMPTFNDLYYTNIGNTDLKPEYTHQYNLGVVYTLDRNRGFVRHFEAQIDAYYNEVTDKIIAVPKGSGQYRWMMMNIGYVKIKGIDASLSLQTQLAEGLDLTTRLSYTYQRAQDFTERKSDILKASTWGGQIAYIPWHSGSVVNALTFKDWQFNYSFIYVGERYHSSANIPEEYELPWYTNDCAIIKNFTYRDIRYRLGCEINNIFSQDYEVVLNYPMPQRNYKLSLTVEL